VHRLAVYRELICPQHSQRVMSHSISSRHTRLYIQLNSQDRSSEMVRLKLSRKNDNSVIVWLLRIARVLLDVTFGEPNQFGISLKTHPVVVESLAIGNRVSACAKSMLLMHAPLPIWPVYRPGPAAATRSPHPPAWITDTHHGSFDQRRRVVQRPWSKSW
jgi:hypothetical protein